MPLKIDCGDVELTLNLVFGMKYPLPPNEEERIERLPGLEKWFVKIPVSSL